MSSAGFIKLHRVLSESDLNDLNPAHFKVAIHLLLMANWKPKERVFKGETFLIDRGQVASSLHAITTACGKGIKIGQVRRAVSILEKIGFLRVESTPKFTYLTILNYSSFQDVNEGDRQQNDITTTSQRQQNDIRTAPIEEGKNERTQEGKKDSQSPKASTVPAPDSTSKKEKPRSTKKPPGTEATEIAEYFLVAIRSHNPDHVTTPAHLTGWARDIDLAMRVDGRTRVQLMNVIDHVHRDEIWGNWKANMLSGKKLRANMNRFLGEMAQKSKESSKPAQGKFGSARPVPIGDYGEVGVRKFNRRNS